MNYRHIYHAGNFADLLKHAVLTELLGGLVRAPAPLTVIDTHAGAGLYDLQDPAAVRTGEGEAGVGRLMADASAPGAFDSLKAAVRRANGAGVRYYPGSPLLIAEALRTRDRYIACELRPDDNAALKRALPRELGAQVLLEDGWAAAAARAPRAPAPLLVLIDPPFERADDHAAAVSATRAILGRNPAAVVAVWTPIKDLASFDAFLSDMEEATHGRRLLVAEARLRSLSDPMTLNGCAMLVVNPLPSLEARASEAARWIVRALGASGAAAAVRTAVG